MNKTEIIPADLIKQEFTQALTPEIIKRMNEKIKSVASRGETATFIGFSEFSIKPMQIEDLKDELSGAGYIVIPRDMGVNVKW